MIDLTSSTIKEAGGIRSEVDKNYYKKLVDMLTLLSCSYYKSAKYLLF